MQLDIGRAFPDSLQVTIKRYASGERNDLGELERGDLTEVKKEVAATIDPVRKIPDGLGAYNQQLIQGVAVRFLFMMTLSASQSVEDGDVIEDSSGVQYDVLFTLPYPTHKEVYLRRWKQ